MPRPITITYQVWPTSPEVAAAAAELFTSAAAAAVHARGLARVPWSKLQLFWVDERCVPPDHPDSNYRMTSEAMLAHVPLPPENVHRMEGELDPEVAASRYEAAIRTAFRLEGAETPVFDLILLGMGDDGHTASLFPHTEALNELARIVVANHVPQKDTWRISLTFPVINRGREVAFLIEGAAKAQILHDVLLGPHDPDSRPSQLIRPSTGRLTFLLDAAAAAKLPDAPASGAQPRSATLELR